MYNQVIQFWFHEIERKKRFAKDKAFDDVIRTRFGEIHTQATKCELFSWRSTALGCLAEVIVLDQFSRNIYRDQRESFSCDSLALSLAQSAISRGIDINLNIDQRTFLYMPFMHSESLIIHEQAVSLFTNLGVKSNLEYELKHRAIIEQFGRYPHRNKVLGRNSTNEEKAFLLHPGSGF